MEAALEAAKRHKTYVIDEIPVDERDLPMAKQRDLYELKYGAIFIKPLLPTLVNATHDLIKLQASKQTDIPGHKDTLTAYQKNGEKA